MTPHSTLTERYVAAAVRSLPENQRDDVERELRASIEDDIDARIESGVSSDAAERDVLTELGDPSGLAARYSERPLYLIGPTNFLVYRRTLVLIVSMVAPIASIASGAAHALAGDAIGEIIASVVVTAFTSAIQIAFWLTLVFAVLDWSGASRRGPLVPWTVESLPDVPERRAQLGDTIASLVFLGLAVAFVFYQQFLPVAWNREGAVDAPLLDPALWSSWIPVILVLMVLEAVSTIVKYRAGGWTWPLAILNIVLASAGGAVVAVLALAGSLYNPAFFAAFPWGTSAGILGVIAVGTAVLSIVIALWDAIDGVVRTARMPRGSRA
ncbi:permease prefix domain 1-containing protein [Labedella endophytica]|uniref:Uncharacterized protein n=1 Tax=Labedella endophytica TaxID=1523160 RepID=A0A433JWY7_9MICO|nr:permease prefix domain 1-containing protein [Labedella endophytica]RUR03483.1 hypothetical protein ELQ94_02785 [Labedella endophytica]